MSKITLHKNLRLILGPPGTGKTTELLRIMDEELANDTPPARIAYVSFTRKAAYEARDRAQATRPEAPEGDFAWFRTLHSLAFRCMGINKEQVFGRKHAIELGQMLGVYIGVGNEADKLGPEGDIDVTAGGTAIGNVMLFIDNLSRVKKISLDEAWHLVGDDRIELRELQRVVNSYRKYKTSYGLYDFTDMITAWTEERHFVPALDVVIVDEAQDLSLVQWDMVKKLVAGAKRVYIAGDDDQAIYTWSGADVETFLNLKAKDVKTLDHSYRLPKRVFTLANKIAGRIQHRYSKAWAPRDDDGEVNYIVDLEEAPLSSGQWLILARNRCLLDQFVDHCVTMGYPFSSPGYKPLDDTALRAVRYWEDLRKGKQITVAAARLVYEHLKVGSGVARGYKTLPGLTNDSALVDLDTLMKNYGLRTQAIWHVALERIPLEQREYYISLLKRGERLSVTPRISIGTIHSVKGGEADNVLLCTDCTYRTYAGRIDDPDPEHRVFYVGVTRAKQRLYIMLPSGQFGYPVAQ